MESTNIKITAVLTEAWQLMRHSKWPLVLVTIAMIVIMGLCQKLVYKLFGVSAKEAPYLLHFIVIPIITNILIAPLYAGAMMTAIRRARQETVTAYTGFHYFQRWGSLAAVMVIIGVLASLLIWIIHYPSIHTFLGRFRLPAEIISNLFPIFFYTFFIMAMPLIADENKNMREAMQLSVEKVKPHWRSIFLLFLIIYAVLLIAILPVALIMIGASLMQNLLILLGLVLIAITMTWAIPFVFLVQGVAYRQLRQ